MKSQPQRSITAYTKPLKLYEKTYRLPVLGSSEFVDIQEDIKTRQQLIKEGKKRSPLLFGILSKEEELTFEERFKELEKLIKNYNIIINFLETHKEAYEIFFIELIGELKNIVAKKCNQLAELELERLELELAIQDDDALLATLKSEQKSIFKSAFLLYEATQLMLKKVTLINNSIKKLAEDQQLQKDLLTSMVGRLENYQKVYKLQQKRKQVQKEIQKLADVAINFEQYLSDFLSPFQGLIDQVVKIDSQLSGTVQEIKGLAEDILSQESGFLAYDNGQKLSDSLMGFLVQSNLKKERLQEAMEQSQWANINSLDQLSLPESLLEEKAIATALNSIQSSVNEQFDQFTQTIVIVSANKESPKQPQASAKKPDSVIVSANVSAVCPEGIESLKKPPKELQLDCGNGVKLELVKIPAGEFMMGDSEWDISKPIHNVKVKAFYMGKYQVTQKQYEAVIGKNPSHFKGENNPVECVSWNDAQEFCRKLSAKTGTKVRLPSEAEWEYACRAGTKTKFFFGDNAGLLSSYAWYDGNSNKQAHPVGQKTPNKWKLYDMHGDVWEWCEDKWHPNYIIDPLNSNSWLDICAYTNVLRGGSWYDNADGCRAGYRHYFGILDAYRKLGLFGAAEMYSGLGFRVVVNLE